MYLEIVLEVGYLVMHNISLGLQILLQKFWRFEKGYLWLTPLIIEPDSTTALSLLGNERLSFLIIDCREMIQEPELVQLPGCGSPSNTR